MLIIHAASIPVAAAPAQLGPREPPFNFRFLIFLLFSQSRQVRVVAWCRMCCAELLAERTETENYIAPDAESQCNACCCITRPILMLPDGIEWYVLRISFTQAAGIVTGLTSACCANA